MAMASMMLWGSPSRIRSVHKCAGVALVGVTGHIFLAALGLRGELPLHPVEKPAPPAAAEAGFLDLCDDLFRGSSRSRGLTQGFIPVKRYVFVYIFRIDDTAVPQCDTRLFLINCTSFRLL